MDHLLGGRKQQTVSDHIGLYYPSIGFKDDAWVKFAALYWDKLGRIPAAHTETFPRTDADPLAGGKRLSTCHTRIDVLHFLART
jgi:hypothetical protein